MEEITMQDMVAEDENKAIAQKGKKQLVILIVVYLTMEIIFTAFNSSLMHVRGNSGEAAFELAQGAFRFMLTCLLFFFIYIGHRWARILMVVLSCLAIVIALFLSFVPGVPMWFIALAIPFIIIVILLLGKPIKAFQQYQRDNRLKVKG